ncbi:hypothetical protein SAMN05421504_1011388 [Amycolatopsis xylanica]|uniref:Uncharacterized protein n=1 Tax=Amycolatopsis xylanica TaxID=589385 RepID=A0A1H2W040_9PSEU|nr:hypothetical protein SAMN05421504_1011388 [Amycolatopsis xylanica]
MTNMWERGTHRPGMAVAVAAVCPSPRGHRNPGSMPENIMIRVASSP